MTRVLVVDDEAAIIRALKTSLQARGYAVLAAYNGRTALTLLSRDSVDVVVLDLGLPDMDGTEVLKRIRAFSDVPIIVLTVRDSQADKVGALDQGADDYVTKPFAIGELLARIKATLRRTAPEEPPNPVRSFGAVRVDLSKKLVRRDGDPVRLTRTEYALLEAMVTNPGKLLTHRWLLSQVWGPGYDDQSQYLRVYMGQLRKKLEVDPAGPRLIMTEPGLGYRWAPDPEAD